MRRDGKSVEFSILVRRFFSDYLLNQKNVSPETVLSYRDTFRILLAFFRERKNRDALSLRVEDLDAENILDYLNYLEKERGNSVRTRNIRLAAIRSFLKFVAAVNSPEYLSQAQRVTAIPFKRSDRMLVGFLSKEALEAILKAPDERTWSGRRDRIMFAFMYNTGARVSETVALRVSAVSAATDVGA